MRSVLITLAALVLAAAPARAFQGPFEITSVNGGAIPPSGSGGGTYPGVLPNQPFVSTMNVPFPVVSVFDITLFGFSHAFAGDVQVVLEDPTSKRYNLFVRSGFNGAGTGNPNPMTSGAYFIQSTGTNAGPFPGSGTIVSGFYLQDFGGSGTPPSPWPNGTNNIFNTPLEQIHGPAGTWKLVIYDWRTNNTGTLGSWRMRGSWNDQPITPMCQADGSLATPCPCGNTGLPGRGCQNSTSTGGALLAATGGVNPDSVVLTVLGENPTSATIFLQGSGLVPNGAVFGDGVRCAGGTLKRLYVKTAANGFVSAPGAGDPSITARSAALGDPIAPASTRFYQTYYRDGSASFCPLPTGNTFNASSGLKIVWI